MANRGFLNHIWFKLLSEEGVPVPSAAITVLSLNLQPITLFDSTGVSGSTDPIYTDTQGIFDFYVKDDIGNPSGGYPWNTRYVISWNDGVDKSGLINAGKLFGDYEQVDETDTNSRINKAMSNWLGFEIEEHVNFMFGTTARCGSSSSSSSSESSSSESSSSESSSSESSSSESSSSTSEFASGGYFTDTTSVGNPSGYSFTGGQNRPLLVDDDLYRRIDTTNVGNRTDFGIAYDNPVTIDGLRVWFGYFNATFYTTWGDSDYFCWDCYKSNDNITWTFVKRFYGTGSGLVGVSGFNAADNPTEPTVAVSEFRYPFDAPETARMFKLHSIPYDIDINNAVVIRISEQVYLMEMKPYIT